MQRRLRIAAAFFLCLLTASASASQPQAQPGSAGSPATSKMFMFFAQVRYNLP